MEQLEHAILAPSSAHQWRVNACPGSVKLQLAYPEEETEEAKEGNAAHWVGSSILEAFKGGDNSLVSSAYVGQTAPNGVIINEEMAEAAAVYVEDVLDIMQRFGLLRSLKVEQRVYVPRVHAENWGTYDAGAFDEKNGVLYGWDFKYGHRFVDAFENFQLINYMAGVLDGLPGVDGQSEQHITVVMRVVQPRYYNADPVREWRVMGHELRPYVNLLNSGAMEAMKDNPTVRSGPHCRDCTARHSCRAAQNATMVAIDYVMNLADSVNELPADALGTELDILKRAHDIVKARMEGLESRAIALHTAGKVVTGWDVKQGKGLQKWNVPIPEVLSMGDLMGHKLKKPDAAITPKQAIKLGIDETVIKAYSVTPSTGLKLVKSDTTKAKRVFSKEVK